jgi:hypothetical protein
MPNLLLLQSCSEIEVSKVEERMYLKTAVFCRGNAQECHAQLHEALDDDVLLC